MKKIYLDNAATTQMRHEVIVEMTKVLEHDYGNPSSTHSFGRQSKNQVELSRKSIAKLLQVASQEIIFTSSGTEANNWILRSAIKDLKVERIISSKIEHHAVLHVVESLKKEFDIQIDFVSILANGEIDINHLVQLLSQEKKTLVSLMHVNNEIGTILDLNKIGRICKQHRALFHSDAVQSMGKIAMDLKETSLDFLVASAHKFHGPKGIGFAFIRKNSGLQPLLLGGEQEKGMRAGTEAVHQIVGLSAALTASYENLITETDCIRSLKTYFIAELKKAMPAIKINGNENGIHTIINVALPFSSEKTALLLFNLDMKGIAVSRGSACQSGSSKPSHVLAEILSDEDVLKPSLRISFSHYNTFEEIDSLVSVLVNL